VRTRAVIAVLLGGMVIGGIWGNRLSVAFAHAERVIPQCEQEWLMRCSRERSVSPVYLDELRERGVMCEGWK
jgi:hypothetical protein